MEAAGVNETAQILKVSVDGSDHFIRIVENASGKALNITQSSVKGIAKLVALIYKQTKARASMLPGEVGIKELIESTAKYRQGLMTVSIGKEELSEFSDYAASRDIPFSVLADGEKVQLVYGTSSQQKINTYVRQNGNTEYRDLIHVAASKPYIDVKNEYIRLAACDIVDIDETKSLVKVKCLERKNEDSYYVDLPARSLVMDSDKNIYLKLNKTNYAFSDNSRFEMNNDASLGMMISRDKLREMINNYNESAERDLSAKMDFLEKNNSLDFAENVRFRANLMANKKEIERRYHRAELGINDKTKAVSFFNGKDKKIFLKGTTMKDKNIVTSKKIMEKRVKSK